MSKTADTTWWNQKSRYHTKRLTTVAAEIDTHVWPRIAANTRPGAITVADLACGGGGPAIEVISRLKQHGYTIQRFVLIDVVRDNLDATGAKISQQFPDIPIESYRCDGSSFQDYNRAPVDVLYCWDAMVHFDIHDVAGYLKTLSQVVKGTAIFHHSNNYTVTHDIRENPRWRNFMSDRIFHQLAVSAGHTVVSQDIIPWGDHAELDCITVLRT